MVEDRPTRARVDEDQEGGFIVPLKGEVDRDGNEFDSDDNGIPKRIPRSEYHERTRIKN